MSNDLENFDFLELGQAIQDAREKQRITREELAEELGIVHSTCYNVPHIRRPVHTPRHSDRENNFTSAVRCAS